MAEILAIRQFYLHHGRVDIAQPLSTLAPSLDGDVLTVLARTEAPLTGRRVAALARRGSRPGVQTILDRLVDHGVVHAQPAGPSTLFTLNREHLLAEPVILAVTARDRLLSRLREHIEGWRVPAAHTSLFGSTARGEAGPQSDIDVVVVRPAGVDPDEPAWVDQLATLEGLVEAWTGNSLAWFETTEEGLARADSEREPLLESLRRDAIHLTGRRLGDLVHVTRAS